MEIHKIILLFLNRKVFTLLLLQLLATFGLVALFTFHSGINESIKDSSGLLYASIALFVVDIICIGVITFKPALVRATPLNYITLLIVTIATAILLATITAHIE